HGRHPHVEQDGVHRVLVEDLQGLLTVRGEEHLVAFRRQQLVEDPSDRQLVVDDEHAAHGCDLADRHAHRRRCYRVSWVASGDDRPRRSPSGAPYLVLDGNTLRSGPALATEQRDALVDLVAEVVEWRLAEYLSRLTAGCRFTVLRSGSNKPILK